MGRALDLTLCWTKSCNNDFYRPWPHHNQSRFIINSLQDQTSLMRANVSILCDDFITAVCDVIYVYWNNEIEVITGGLSGISQWSCLHGVEQTYGEKRHRISRTLEILRNGPDNNYGCASVAGHHDPLTNMSSLSQHYQKRSPKHQRDLCIYEA